MRTFIGSAGILVLASHSNDLIREWYTEGLWLQHGRGRMRDAVDEVLGAYTESAGR